MVTRIVLLLALVGCQVSPYADGSVHSAPFVAPAAPTFVSVEDRHYAVQAALLDPSCWQLATATPFTFLDVTVPDGHAWYTTNAFAVWMNTPNVYAQDGHPFDRQSGFIRSLNVNRAAVLPPGTHVQSNTHSAYLLYCDPATAWASDARYTDDPRALYFGRLARLEALPLESVVLEANGGGDLRDVVTIALPTTGAVMVNAVSAYNVAWCTIGWPDNELNTESEINNSHTVRFAEAELHPLPWRGSAPVFRLQKGSTSDGAGAYAVTNGAVRVPSSADYVSAFPIKGSCSLWYWQLPVDW